MSASPAYVCAALNSSGSCSSWVDLFGALADVGLTEADVFKVFAMGFGAILVPWSIGYTVGITKQVLSKV